jgi:hypothetical protein
MLAQYYLSGDKLGPEQQAFTLFNSNIIAQLKSFIPRS